MRFLTPTLAAAVAVSGAATHYRQRSSSVDTRDGGGPQSSRRQSDSILDGYYADPNIAVFDDTYYIYPTTVGGVSGVGGMEFYVFSSTDLVTWTRSADPILTFDQTSTAAPVVPWANADAWAPTIIERDGSYYLYFSGNNTLYTGADSVQKTIGAAVGTSPTGPFTPQATAMIYNNESVTATVAIDPAAFLDPVSGAYYLFWGNGASLHAQLADDMVSIDWTTATTTEFNTSSFPAAEVYFEAPFLVYRDGLYHLTYSVDDTSLPTYHVGYATAPALAGPYTYRGTILQEDAADDILGTGSSSTLNVPGTDDWYVAYHRFAVPDGNGAAYREVTLDVLSFGSDGFIEDVVPTVGGVAAETVP